MKYGVFDSDGKPKAFYDDAIHATIPDGAVVITEAQWQELLSDQAMKRFVGGKVINRTRSLEEVKAEKVLALERLRIKKAEGGVAFGNKRIPTDKAALVLLQSARGFVGKKPNAKFKKAGLGEFDAASLDSLLDAVGEMQRPIYAHESDLYDQIMACTTVAEVDAIDINAGWPGA